MTYDELKSLIGDRVRRLRIAKGMKQEGFAEAIGKSVETVSNIERGNTAPSLELLQVIAGVFEIPMENFVAAPAAEVSDHTAMLRARAGTALDNLPEQQLAAAVELLEAIDRTNRASK